MNAHRFRRLGGAWLILVWAQVATANALPCGLECALESQHEHHAHHPTPTILLTGQGRSGPAISASHFCQTLQPLSPTFVTPEFPETPPVTSTFSAIVIPFATSHPSIIAEFDTPPPRA